MQIYVVVNPAKSTTDAVCDSQATIDAGIAAGYEGTFIIGTEADANALLEVNRQAWLTEQANVFVVNQKIITDLGAEWVTVNLSTEPANTDRIYVLLNVPQGDWVEEIGLDAAKAMFFTIQQNYLVYSGLGSVTYWTNWPPKSS